MVLNGIDFFYNISSVTFFLFLLPSSSGWFFRFRATQQLVVIGITGKHYKQSPIPNKLGTMHRHGRPVETRIVHAKSSSLASTTSATNIGSS